MQANGGIVGDEVVNRARRLEWIFEFEWVGPVMDVVGDWRRLYLDGARDLVLFEENNGPITRDVLYLSVRSDFGLDLRVRVAGLDFYHAYNNNPYGVPLHSLFNLGDERTAERGFDNGLFIFEVLGPVCGDR